MTDLIKRIEISNKCLPKHERIMIGRGATEKSQISDIIVIAVGEHLLEPLEVIGRADGECDPPEDVLHLRIASKDPAEDPGHAIYWRTVTPLLLLQAPSSNNDIIAPMLLQDAAGIQNLLLHG